MFIQNEEDIIALVQNDEWMMELLTCAKSLDVPSLEGIAIIFS